MIIACDFHTEARDGFYHHRCRRCGYECNTYAPTRQRRCEAPESALSVASHTAEAIPNKQICRGCLERPAGCWKAIDYGCACEYRGAEKVATESGDCPLHKLTRPAASKTLIGVFTAPKYDYRLAVCERTWLADAREAGQPFVIVCTGAKPNTRERLWLDLPDNLPALPRQIRGWIRWALERPDWTYLFKCDDDTYVSIPRFMAFDPAGRDYVGGWCRYHGETYAHGGGGYFLSRRAAAIVAERLTHAEGPEDLLVGRVLREAGIPVSLDGRFLGWAKEHNRPGPHSHAITGHTKRHDLFYAMHRDAGLHGRPPETRTERNTRLRRKRQTLLAARLQPDLLQPG